MLRRRWDATGVGATRGDDTDGDDVDESGAGLRIAWKLSARVFGCWSSTDRDEPFDVAHSVEPCETEPSPLPLGNIIEKPRRCLFSPAPSPALPRRACELGDAGDADRWDTGLVGDAWPWWSGGEEDGGCCDADAGVPGTDRDGDGDADATLGVLVLLLPPSLLRRSVLNPRRAPLRSAFIGRALAFFVPENDVFCVSPRGEESQLWWAPERSAGGLASSGDGDTGRGWVTTLDSS